MSDQSADQQAAVQQQKALSNQTDLPQSQLEKERTQAAADFDQSSKTSRSSMHVKVHSPFQSYYDGDAFSISAENATGPFDILPQHHNFISLLNACELVIRGLTDGERRIRISGGIMNVKANRVVVFLDV